MDFLSQGFRVGRLFDITVRIHFVFVLWIAFELMNAGANWQYDLWFLVMLFGIVLMHEFGHCFGARSVGGDANDILLWPLGGLAYADAPMRPWEQFVTVAAGPAVNLLFCIIAGLAIFAFSGWSQLPWINPLRPEPNVIGAAAFQPLQTPLYYSYIFYHVNLFLLAFNLLPIFPMDGGQLFRVLLWTQMGLQRATVLACQIGIGGAIVLAGLSLSQGGGILLFIAIFGAFTSWQMLQATKYGGLVEDARSYTYGPSNDTRTLWEKVFKTRRRRRPAAGFPIEHPNPNPGGWEEKQRQQAEEEAELDRLLRKVSEEGIGSLSYVERQKLERITRKRKEEEQAYQRDTRI